MGASVGIPASALAISRKLYFISTANVGTLTNTGRNKWRNILIDTAICIVFPFIFIACQYAVQGHRFDIFEDVGCYPAVVNTPLTYGLAFIWPIIIGLICAVYCALTLKAFMSQRAQLASLQTSNNTSLTVDRYFRLMALTTVQIFLITPLAILAICLNTTSGPLYRWISWEETHWNYGYIGQIPAVMWKSRRRNHVAVEMTRWANLFCALIFFAFFGITLEARRHYGKVLSIVGLRLGTQNTRDVSRSSPSEPQFVILEFNQSQDGSRSNAMTRSS